MDNIVEIILQAVDNASDVFSSVTGSAEDMGSTMETATAEASSGFEDMETAAQGATGTIQDVIDYCQSMDGAGPQSAADGMDTLEQEATEADDAVNNLNNDLGIVNSSMLLQLADQVGQIGSNAEGMAQEMNTAAISVGQLATQTGIAEPEMVSLINTISNATFPNDEAMLYVKSLDQMGVSAENFAQSATDIDKINDAFGLGAQTTNSMAVELGVLGVDLNNVSTSFNALAYANANTAGGMQNFYTFLRKYDSQFNELGLNVDQAAVAIAGATQKFGGGKAAFTGMNEALKESNGDLGVLEQKLGLASGSLTNATDLTGQYEGQLQQLADEEAEHKTLLDQLGAAWEDISLSLSGVLGPLSSAVGFIGQIGQFGLQVSGLRQLVTTFKEAKDAIIAFNIVEKARQVLVKIGGTITAAWGTIVGIVTGEIGLMTAATAAWNAILAMNPIILVVGAIILLIAAIYEVGKAFGWWTDVSSMLDAIWAGLQRLWDAFINHPDVQAALQAISSALQWIWQGLQQAGQAVLDFFGISTSGNFDIVRALIDAIGNAWSMATAPIRVIIRVFQEAMSAGEAAGDAFGAFWNDTLVPFGEWLNSIFAPVWQFIGDTINAIMPYITAVTDGFDAFMNGQMSLPDLIMTVMTSIFNIYVTVMSRILGAITSWAGSLLGGALSAGGNFVNGIVSWISQLPGRVWTYLVTTAGNIRNSMSQWVATARARASLFVSGVITRIAQLPGRVYSALMGVVSRIIGAIQAWINAGRSKVQGVISAITGPFSGVAGKISSGLSGVANAITRPFQQAWNTVRPWIDKIKGGIDTISSVFSLGGEPALGGETALPSNSSSVPYIVNTDNSPIEVNENINLNLDLSNVPSHIDTGTLIEALTDKTVLQSLTGNLDFQTLDARVKQRINLKQNRARGV